jgi:beta-galactosidase
VQHSNLSRLHQSLFRCYSIRLGLGSLLLPGCVPASAIVPAKLTVGCTRTEMSIDKDWHFHLGDLAGSEQPTVDDSNWQLLDLPHDWAIGAPFLPANPSGGAGAFATMDVGWYRKHLATPPANCPRRTIIQFDGVMANSQVWVNGRFLGQRPNGYVTFQYDLTPYLSKSPGGDNIVAVRADNSRQPSSRFYQGAGIYRHVHLLFLPQLHFDAWSTVITTPNIAAGAATVRVATILRNNGSDTRAVAVAVTLLDARGRQQARTITAPISVAAGDSAEVAANLRLPHPRLWSPSDPALYRANVEVLDGNIHGDREEVTFGVREAHFDAATGFWLNGKNIKIKGVALHSDIGALGMAVPLSLWEHRLRAMQRMGANAVRTAHNPVAPEFLDLCDHLGILVLDEFFDVWTVGKSPYDYHLDFHDWYLTDTRDTVRRDRNHPSIIAWSAGNEIHDTPHPEIAKPILASLIEAYHKEDPTRPVTQALFRPNASHDYVNGLADMLDVIGQNYRPNEILAAHDAKPTRKILGTENIHDPDTWLDVRDHPAYSGMFLWSGTDYLGESRKWPYIGDSSGLMDRTDFPKPEALQRESWWANHPVVYIVRRVAPAQESPTDPGYGAHQEELTQTAFPDWTPALLTSHTEHVEVYSNCRQVTLVVNGHHFGAQPLPANAAPRTWDVNFAPGYIEAVCVDRPGVRQILRTAGPPEALRLSAEVAAQGTGFDDVSIVRLVVIDANGNPVPGVQVPVDFSIQGGRLLATDNADCEYEVPFSSAHRTTSDGRAVALVRASSTGRVEVRVASPGLRSAVLDLSLKKEVH